MATISSLSSPTTPSSPEIFTEVPLSFPPKTIVLSLWPHARDEQVEYYIDGYKALYPSAKLFTLPNSRKSALHIDNALNEIIGDQEKLQHRDASQDILFHVFGEDAAAQACRFLRAYNLRTARTMSVKAMILDAVPVVVAPTLQTLQRSPHLMLLFLWLCVVALLQYLVAILTYCYAEPYSAQIRKDLCDPNLLPSDASRCYIFPDKDIMFAWPHASNEDGALDRQEFAVTRHLIDRERRWSGDQERYWLGIENTWDGQECSRVTT